MLPATDCFPDSFRRTRIGSRGSCRTPLADSLASLSAVLLCGFLDECPLNQSTSTRLPTLWVSLISSFQSFALTIGLPSAPNHLFAGQTNLALYKLSATYWESVRMTILVKRARSTGEDLPRSSRRAWMHA